MVLFVLLGVTRAANKKNKSEKLLLVIISHTQNAEKTFVSPHTTKKKLDLESY